MGIESALHPRRRGVVLRHAAASLAFASEMIHLWVMSGQLLVAVLPGAFFFLVAVGEGLLGASLLFGPGRRTLRFGILLNLFVISVWALTRALSVPEVFAPVRLPVGGLDVAATAVEAVLVVLLVRLRRFPVR